MIKISDLYIQLYIILFNKSADFYIIIFCVNLLKIILIISRLHNGSFPRRLSQLYFSTNLFENILYRARFTASSTLIPPMDLTYARYITEQYIIILHEVIKC